jgi:hypothetical protein
MKLIQIGEFILPGHPDFTFWSQNPNAFKNISQSDSGFVVDYETGLLRPANYQEMIDYVNGGEYNEVLEKDDNDG